MKVYIKILLVILSALTAVSCEKYWDKYEEDKFDMNIYLIAEADSSIRGYVMPVLNSMNINTNKYFSSEYTDTSIKVTNAITALYIVNDGKKDRINKSDRQSDFDEKPDVPLKAGDKVSIELSGVYYKTLTGSVVIPDKPEIEAEYIGETVENGETWMQIKVRIKDNGSKKNFYMLNAVSNIEQVIRTTYISSFYPSDGGDLWTYSSYTGFFKTDSPVFRDDNALFMKQKKRVMWHDNSAHMALMPDNFTNVFSDQQFNGKDYEFVIECPKCASYELYSSSSFKQELVEERYYVLVDVLELSEEYYNYHKTWEYSDMKETIFYFSNVEGGVGILGAVNRSSIIRVDFK